MGIMHLLKFYNDVDEFVSIVNEFVGIFWKLIQKTIYT